MSDKKKARPVIDSDSDNSDDSTNVDEVDPNKRPRLPCSDITNDQLGISGETGHGGANLCIY